MILDFLELDFQDLLELKDFQVSQVNLEPQQARVDQE